MNKSHPKFAVIGAGNCGQAMAAHLKSLGFEVNLFNRSNERIDDIIKNDGITLHGVLSEKWKPDIITTDIGEAVSDADIVMVITPASAHRDLAKSCAPFLNKNQIVILNPGRTFGALEFLNTIKKHGSEEEIIVAEAQTTIYTARLIKNGDVEVLALKKDVWLASIPSKKVTNLINLLKNIYPQFTPVKNVLVTSLNNIGAILHPTPTLFNIGWIEKADVFFKYYYDAVSPTIAKFLEKLDRERMDVAKALGAESISILDWMNMTYGVKANSLYDAIQKNPKYKTIEAPTTVYHRYIFEDIPTGLVPVASFGKMLGVDTPNTRMVIEQACSLLDTNFWEIGRTIERLGLNDLSLDEITMFVEDGKI